MTTEQQIKKEFKDYGITYRIEGFMSDRIVFIYKHYNSKRGRCLCIIQGYIEDIFNLWKDTHKEEFYGYRELSSFLLNINNWIYEENVKREIENKNNSYAIAGLQDYLEHIQKEVLK